MTKQSTANTNHWKPTQRTKMTEYNDFQNTATLTNTGRKERVVCVTLAS